MDVPWGLRIGGGIVVLSLASAVALSTPVLYSASHLGFLVQNECEDSRSGRRWCDAMGLRSVYVLGNGFSRGIVCT